MDRYEIALNKVSPEVLSVYPEECREAGLFVYEYMHNAVKDFIGSKNVPETIEYLSNAIKASIRELAIKRGYDLDSLCGQLSIEVMEQDPSSLNICPGNLFTLLAMNGVFVSQFELEGKTEWKVGNVTFRYSNGRGEILV